MKAIRDILSAAYRVDAAEISELKGDINYTNRKYLVTAADDRRYILKEYIDKDESIVSGEEARIINEASGSLRFSLPVTIPAINGELFYSSSGTDYRLAAFIEGTFLAESEGRHNQAFILGAAIAELNIALLPIKSSIISSRRIFWDLNHAEMSLNDRHYLSSRVRKYVDAAFEDYISDVIPLRHTLRHALIHGDLNDFNILLDKSGITGFIDFGDMVFSPLVNDVAIAAAYIMMGAGDPLEVLAELTGGYNSVHPLEESELEILPVLIRSRLAVSLCNSARLRSQKLANDYTLVSEEPASHLLEWFSTVSPIAIRENLRISCGFKSIIKESENKVDQLLGLRKKYFPSALSVSYRTPVHMVSARFQYMFDAGGNSFLDAYNNIPHVGHSHPVISEAVSTGMRKLNTNTRYIYDSLTGYAERLLSHFPPVLGKMLMVNSGSAASDLAIRMARAATGRNAVAVLEHGYHGNTITGIEISPYKFRGRGGSGPAKEIIPLPLPGEYRGTKSSGIEYAEEAISIIKEYAARNGMPAAFIAEPVSGCGGQVPLSPGYLETLYPWLRANGIITVSDEVQVGFGRLGTHFWGFEMNGIVPDIVILGKPMANGHPAGAVVTTEQVADAFSNGMEFFSSFGGNPVSCAAAEAVLDIIAQE